jgi:CheY-like chemotaxis protein
MRVLHIDDDEDLRNLVSGYIRDYWPDAQIDGYDPMERDLPSTSFSLRPYDLIVLDYMLGRGDGLEWLKALKQRDDCPKILFLTGAGNETIAVRAIKISADDYQRKQELTREKLIASIHELTASPVERTVSPDLAARMEGNDLGAKVCIPGIKVLHMIGEGGAARVYLASRKDEDEPLVVKILRDDALNSTAIERFMEVCDGGVDPEPARRAHPRTRQA